MSKPGQQVFPGDIDELLTDRIVRHSAQSGQQPPADFRDFMEPVERRRRSVRRSAGPAARLLVAAVVVAIVAVLARRALRGRFS